MNLISFYGKGGQVLQGILFKQLHTSPAPETPDAVYLNSRTANRIEACVE